MTILCDPVPQVAASVANYLHELVQPVDGIPAAGDALVADPAEMVVVLGTGVELDDALYKQSMQRIRSLGLAATARIIHGDLLKQDYASADLLTVYLLPIANEKLAPIFEKQLKKGARIVSHNSEFSGWTAVKVENIENDGEGHSHKLYLYQR